MNWPGYTLTRAEARFWPPPEVLCQSPASDRRAENQEHGVTQCTKLMKSGLGAWSFFSITASASCQRSPVQVVRVTAKPGSTPSFIYYRDNALSSFYWVCTTNDANLLNAALEAQNGFTQALIRGDAASCPTTSAADGSRSAGNCLLVVVNP